MIELKHIMKTAAELEVRSAQVEAVGKLLEEGATVPFIARYRKEATGNLDEVQIIAVRDRLEQLRALDERRAAVLKSVEEQGKLTPELKEAIEAAETLARLEDLYLPYKPKKETRADKARKRGLEPLAEKILGQSDFDVSAEAAKYVVESEDAALAVPSAEKALEGARDIIAERINEDAELREEARGAFQKNAVLTSKVIEEKKDSKEAQKYRDYFDFSEPASAVPSHRFLAIRRGSEEEQLIYRIRPEEEPMMELLRRKYVKADNEAAAQVAEAADDCYKRLLAPSLETELRQEMKKKSDEKAIEVFASNLRELLLASPMGQKVTLGVDPGQRTGCKVVVIDAQGNLKEHGVIYPLEPHNKTAEAAAKVEDWVRRFQIEAVAVGNGTGGRESFAFLKSLPCLSGKIVAMVNESGASVYSAGEIARKEFPDQDITVRGAVSIGRRLMDPLAELVKIDPKSIGVGQYQHDVDQKDLKKALDDVVVSCVNAVGVDVNTASASLLGYVSGLSKSLADRIVGYRQTAGPFRSREDLKRVSGMGEKTFEQAAGFLRIPGAENPLDASAVHPESYPVVERMAADHNCAVSDLLKQSSIRHEIKLHLNRYETETVGILTLNDIMDELEKPGRDPREKFDLFSFTEGVNTISDLRVDMELPGVVTNVTAFGAFVDIGVHQDGLVHISELSDSFVKDPADAVRVNQKVKVRVLDVDVERNRISLSMKSKTAPAAGNGGVPASAAHKLKVKSVSSGVPGAKRVITVKKKEDGGEGQRPAPFVSQREERRTNRGYRSSDDDTTYNPFADLLNKKKR